LIISSAAFWVNGIVRKSSGFIPLLIRYAILDAITLVLPDPVPAITSNGELFSNTDIFADC
jgi:hypothetical protein